MPLKLRAGSLGRSRGLASSAFTIAGGALLGSAVLMTAALAFTGAGNWETCLIAFLLGCASLEIGSAVRSGTSTGADDEL